MTKIYFDYASTTPLDPDVAKAMQPSLLEVFGNPSSVHGFGREAFKLLEDAREVVAKSLGAKAEEIVFNSGGTEGANHAIIGLAQSLKNKGKQIIVSSMEHPAVIESIKYLKSVGFEIVFLSCDHEGIIDPNSLRDLITSQTIFVAVMHANNQVGTIQPIREISQILRPKNIPIVVDAVQTVGHLPVKVQELGADLLFMSAHKFYGPKGIGALYIRKGIQFPAYILGGDQERGRRASTQNVAGAVGLAEALKIAEQNMLTEMSTQKRLRDKLLNEIPKNIPGTKVNGHWVKRLPNNAHFSFDKVKGEELVLALDLIGIASSVGSACTSGRIEPSHVLKSMGLDDAMALGSVRFTIGRWTTESEVDTLIEKLPTIVSNLRVQGAR